MVSTQLVRLYGETDGNGELKKTTSLVKRGNVLKVEAQYESSFGSNANTYVFGADAQTDVADIDAEGFIWFVGETNKVAYPQHLVVDTTGKMGSVEFDSGHDLQTEFANMNLVHLQVDNANPNKKIKVNVVIEIY